MAAAEAEATEGGEGEDFETEAAEVGDEEDETENDE